VIIAIMIIVGVYQIFFGGFVLSAAGRSIEMGEFDKLTGALRDLCENPDKSVKLQMKLMPPYYLEYHESYEGFLDYGMQVKQQKCNEKCLCLVSSVENNKEGLALQEVTAKNRIPERCISLPKLSATEYCKKASLSFNYDVKAVKIGKALPTMFGSLYESKGETISKGQGLDYLFPTDLISKTTYIVADEFTEQTIRHKNFVFLIEKNTANNGIRVNVEKEEG